MYKHMLTNKFFKENPYDELSAQRIAYTTLLYDSIEDLVLQYIEKTHDQERINAIEDERIMIEKETDEANLVKLLRKNIDVINTEILIKKVLEYENSIMPEVITRFLTSGNDVYIEHVIRLFNKSCLNYSNLLVEMYGDIRSPYAQSLVCIIIGICGEESIIPWMYDKYRELKKRYPGERYSEGPLIALYEFNDRFYGDN